MKEDLLRKSDSQGVAFAHFQQYLKQRIRASNDHNVRLLGKLPHSTRARNQRLATNNVYSERYAQQQNKEKEEMQ